MAVHRIEVHTQTGYKDPRAERILRAVHSDDDRNNQSLQSADVYLIEGDLDVAQVDRIADELLADPINQRALLGVSSIPDEGTLIEVHPLPGVMDPVAQSVENSILDVLGVDAKVRTGVRYIFIGFDHAEASLLTKRYLANPVVHEVFTNAHHPAAFLAGHRYELQITEVPLTTLDDDALMKLSRSAHLFLSLDEMCEIRDYYKKAGREPRDIELETLAQTWSEHCVHKTLKSTIRFQGDFPADLTNRPGHELNADGSITIHNLLKSTVAAATHELMNDGIDWCLSVFVDNAGIIAFDDDTAVCFKVETHNHPSALEPFGGAATGIGGCIRDIIGTGLAAKPIASTDIFCVADPNTKPQDVPEGCLHPRRILNNIVAGVRDYGNRMGIPTVNGAVIFDNRYIGNPLVYCGSIGVMPRDLVTGDANPGDHIIVLGGATGRDGIHGATFSSAELTDSHADEFSHAVQIGNPITEKQVLDAILEARDHASGCLYSAITDCGAGGYSSAVGEMGEQIGATVHLERAPLKYDGLSYTEIWISEAQERMVLAVPEENIEAIAEICRIQGVSWCDLGTFGTKNNELILNYEGTLVGQLSMDFMHNGIPMPTRDAVWTTDVKSCSDTQLPAVSGDAIRGVLLRLLSEPDIASKHWIIRQYDHEVQGATAIKPLVGPLLDGPSDAAVITPKLNSTRGLGIANGISPAMFRDPYTMTTTAIDECVRNLVCVGVDPSRIAILDNFCWPSCGKSENLASLVLAAEGCYDAAKAFRTPFISGKDSLNNQFKTEAGETIEIPPTLLISGMGIVDDVRKCITMDAKSAGNTLLMVGITDNTLAGSYAGRLDTFKINSIEPMPAVDLDNAPKVAATVASLIANDLVRSAHDCSDGGLLIAAAEMAIAGRVGLHLDLSSLPVQDDPDAASLWAKCYSESPSRYLLEVTSESLPKIDEILSDASIPWSAIGQFDNSQDLTLDIENQSGQTLHITLDDLYDAWRSPLDW